MSKLNNNPASGLVDTHADTKGKARLKAFQRLQRRNFKAATPAEAWRMLDQIIAAASSGNPIPVEAALWLTSVAEKHIPKDIESLIRGLGFIEMGTPRKHDRFEIRERVLELHNSGLSRMNASRRAANEMGCSESLAYHYGFRIEGENLKEYGDDKQL